MLFCDTPLQSVGIIVVVGVIAGIFGIYLQSQIVVLGAAVLLAVILEISVHEYRQDSQYQKAKKQLAGLFQKN